MYKVNIINIHTFECDDYIYCGRGSVLGNPYPISKNNSRDEVCDKYEDYFYTQINSNTNFINELNRINKIGNTVGTVNLGCFCYPSRCHCETIKEYLISNLMEL